MSDYSTRYLVPTFNGLVAQIGLSAGVSIVCIGIFEWNRRKKTLQYLYSPRTRLKVNPSPPMSMHFLGWIKPTIKIPEEFYVANVGLDAVMFLRFLKMCLQFCVFNALVVGIILLPIHYTGGNGLSEVPRMSIANIIDGSDVLWSHVILTYVVTLSWMFLLFKNYWQWMDLRREYTLQRIRQGEIAERSIFISRLPTNLRSDAALKQYFESLKMGPVESATVVQHCGRLSQKIDRRESALNMLEKAHIELAQVVLDSVRHGRFQISPLAVSTVQRPLLHPSKRDSLVVQSTDTTTLEEMVQGLYRDKKHHLKMRKSIFAHKRETKPGSTSLPQLNIPLSALTHQSDIIDIYVHGEEEVEQQVGSSMSLSPPPITIWNALAALDRQTLDRFQPTRPENRFKGGERVPAIDHLVKKYNKLDRKVGELRDGSLRYKSTSFGFVTFKHHLSAQLCAQAKIDSRPQGLSVRLAMEPRDVLWSNLTASFRNRFSRSVVVNLSVWVLIIFWIFPTSSFLLLTSLGALSARYTFLAPILEASPLIQSLLQNVLPIVFVTIFLALAPVIILEISKQELPVSHSALEGNVFRRYYHFLIFNVLFVFMIGTAILKSIITLIQKPTNIFTLLAASLPSGSTFFVFYIVFNTCTHALELVQVWAQLVIHAFVTSRKLTPTPRSLQRATVPWAFQYYYYYPQNILAMVITFIYSIINPLILIAAAVYFAFAVLVFKYQLAYCYIRKYENSGRFFRHVFQYTTDGLIIFQITMAGVLWLKQALVGGFFVIVLIGFTAYFKILCGDLFKSRTKFLPLDTGLRNFDNESSYNMNEIPSQSEADSARSSAIMEPRLRRRNVEGMDVKSSVTDEGHTGPLRTPRTSMDLDEGDVTVTLDGQANAEATTGGCATGSSGLGLSLSGITDDRQCVKGLNNASKNLLRLKIHTKDEIEVVPSPTSNQSSTRSIKLFTVGDDPLDGPKYEGEEENEKDHDQEEEQSPTGFLDEDGFYLKNFGVRHSRMICQPLASHFEHTPCKHVYQDRTSDFETYIHPALLKPLNRKLWLPKNPLYKHWDLDDTVEIDFALNASATVGKLEFRVRDKETDALQSPQMNMINQQRQYYIQRRNTIGSNRDNGVGVSLPSPSNWQGCLSDSPPNTAAPVPGPPGSQWDKYDEKRPNKDETTGAFLSTESLALSPSQSRKNSGYDGSIPVRSVMAHSDSLASMRAFLPSSPHSASTLQPPPRFVDDRDDAAASGNTRCKRSASMPPAPLPAGGSTVATTAAAGGTAGKRWAVSPPPTSSAFLSVRRPRYAASGDQRSGAALQNRQPGSANQSPRVLFVQDTASTPLNVRSTMFARPRMHRHTVSHGQGNSIHHGPLSGDFLLLGSANASASGANAGSAVRTGASGSIGAAAGVNAGAAAVAMNGNSSLPRKGGVVRGTAGAFFSMIFGDPEDDVLEANENPRFGYETGGIWSSRRGSIDHHDDDDDDDDDSEHHRPSNDANESTHMVINMADVGLGAGNTGSVSVASPGAASSTRTNRLGDLALAQPSHLDLSETDVDRETGGQLDRLRRSNSFVIKSAKIL
ncbi:hypothetical protein BGZ58_010173 [Dissophora ornata]|nr:hypothetical protein BGZ58_010173 [Dissophora ornata]